MSEKFDFSKIADQEKFDQLSEDTISVETPESYDSREILSKEIKVIFKDGFPDDYVNDVKWWGNISKEELGSELPDGTKKVLTMDVDIGNVCSLGCPHCFRRTDNTDKKPTRGWFNDAEVAEYILAAKKLGLKQIKILGRGEPFENSNFLSFLRTMTKEGIGVSVFTKGHVIGSDELVNVYYRGQFKTDENLRETDNPIKTSVDLVEELKKLNISILLGFNSFKREKQEEFVGTRADEKVLARKEYVEYRDRALTLLAKAGFNDYKEGEATRLAMIAAPVKPENIDEIFDLYKWARTRNIYALTCPTTETTRWVNDDGQMEKDRQKKFEDFPQKLEDLWADIYKWAIKSNLIPLRKFLDEGASLYPGCHVCNQTAAGFYLNLSGQINQCPGRFDEDTVFAKDIRDVNVDEGEIRKMMDANNAQTNINENNKEYELSEKAAQLKKIWLASTNHKRAQGQGYNYRCAARDGHSLKSGFYARVEGRVIKDVLNDYIDSELQTILNIVDFIGEEGGGAQIYNDNISRLKSLREEIQNIKNLIDEMKDEQASSHKEIVKALDGFKKQENAVSELQDSLVIQAMSNDKLLSRIEKFKEEANNVMRVIDDVMRARNKKRSE